MKQPPEHIPYTLQYNMFTKHKYWYKIETSTHTFIVYGVVSDQWGEKPALYHIVVRQGYCSLEIMFTYFRSEHCKLGLWFSRKVRQIYSSMDVGLIAYDNEHY